MRRLLKWTEPKAKKYYSLTHPQKRIWYTEQISSQKGLFNLGGILRIKGKIDIVAMEKAVRLMIERNDALRLSILMNQNGEPMQYLRDLDDYRMPYYDLSNQADPSKKAQALIEEKTAELLPVGEFVQCILIKIAADDYLYLQKCHHIVCDGWAFALIKQELEICYRHFLTGEKISELPPSYLKFLEDEANYRTSSRFEKHRQFWLASLENFRPAVSLSRKQKGSKAVTGKRYTWQLTSQIKKQIDQFVTQSSASVYAFFLTLLFTYIYRFTRVEDIIIGTPVLNRANARQKATVGMFVSTMPFRVQLTPESTFAEFLKLIANKQKRYYRNQKYPMDRLVKDLQLSKQGNPKLFEISLSYQNSNYEQSFFGYPIKLHWQFNGYVENPLTIHINDRMDQGELVIDFDYAIDAFTHLEIVQIAKHLIQMATEVLVNPHERLKNIQYLAPEEINQIVYQWNQTTVDYPGNQKTICQIIEEQVKKTPEQIAVIFGEQQLTYQKLNNLANQLAKELLATGIGPDQIVGLLTERSLETIVGIFGILKAGGAYLPIEVNSPEKRCLLILEDSQCNLLLTQSFLEASISKNYSGRVLFLDDFLHEAKEEEMNMATNATPDNLVYVIYTSGSTGQPKGVMIENRGLTNYIYWAKDYYCQDGESSFPLYSSLAFDLTVTSIFIPLVTGKTIYLIGNQRGNLIEQIIEDDLVKIVKLTPAHLSLIVDDDHQNSSITKFILGGDALPTELARDAIQSFSDKLEIFNEYGPTETVVGCMIYKFDQDEELSSVPIGKPINNTQIYLLDEYLQPVPIGAVGEIYISGDGVARGYLNRPELTAEKFFANPFIPGKRMYKSGDLGRFRLDGNLEYLGRVDTQVKIQGYRIEMGEVEVALSRHPGVKSGVVDVRFDDSGNKFLVGYFVSDRELTVGNLRSQLSTILAEYMIPKYFIQIPEIPLTINGKVNRTALPTPSNHLAIESEYVVPTNTLEKVIADIWVEVLGLEKVGINDNFFELGGDSIKAIQISARLKNHNFSCQVQDIFSYPTISQLALKTTTLEKQIRAEQGIVSGEVNLTPIISWFFSLKLKNPNYYQQSVILNLSSDIQLPILSQAWQLVIAHHDALRLNWDYSTEKLYHQNEYLDRQLVIPVFDLSGLSFEDQKREIVKLSGEIKGSFYLEDSLLIKLVVFDLGKKQRKLFITAHHLIIDGVSWRILLKDLSESYHQFRKKGSAKLPLKTTSFQEWASLLSNYSRAEDLQKEIVYWNDVLAKYIPLEEINEDDYETIAETVKRKIVLNPKETAALLGSANEAYKTRINELLITGLALTISAWVEREFISIWLEGHGREEINVEIDLTRTIGWFTSLYPVNLDLRGFNELGNQIKSLKEQLRQIPQKGLGYGLLKYFTSELSPVRQDLPGIVFNYLGRFDQDLETELFAFADQFTGPEISPVNQRTNLLEINALIIENQLEIEINFSSQRYQSDLIAEMLNNYLHKLREIIAHCSDISNYGFTPSDFETVNLSQEELDQLFC